MKQSAKLVIAVDGYSSCGKSTLAKDLAKKLDITYVDSGAMYRAVTLYAMQNGLIKDGEVNKQELIKVLKHLKITFRYSDERKRQELYLNDIQSEDLIRKMDVSDNVSYIAKIKEVRQQLVEWQRLISREQSVIMDGRDIGTVVFPDADLKIFMTADNKIRAQRRYKELRVKYPEITFDEVMENIAKRDHIDENREESPLKKAEDAFVLDNSFIDREEQLGIALQKVNEVLVKE